MDTVYPNNEEIKFRKDNYGDIEVILNSKVKCTICNDNLLHEIISKKMIMVHQSHLFLCCYNCFYKLCEGNKYSCILCKSNKDLSNCIKCNLNVCNRCVENHEIDIVSIGVLNKCFNCAPKMLWKERAQAAIVLKVFSSQLCLPNGLLVNETDHEQAVRKYLVKEAKIGQNSKIDNIKNNLCIDFIFNSYKLSITNELSTFSPKDYSQINDHLNEFINICEHVLEKTCSTLTNFKRIFNINSHLSPGVSSIMKSLLKPVDEDENVLVNNSILNGNFSKNTKSNTTNCLIKTPNKRIKRNLRSEKKQEIDTNNLKTIISSSVTPTSSSNELSAFKDINKTLTVVIERLDDSIISSMISKSSNKIHLGLEKNETAHPLNLFDDNSDSDDKEEYTRKLRNRTLIKTNKIKNQAINSTKSQNIPNAKSDDEKENDRLTNLKHFEKFSKKKNVTDDEDNSDDTNIVPTNNTNLKVHKKKSDNEIDKLESIHQFLSTLDATDSGTDNDFHNGENSLESVKCIFTEIKNSVGIPLINTEDNSDDESDDSSINDVINSCLAACKRRSIEHYQDKTQELESSIYDMETIHESELENEDIEMSESSTDIHNNTTVVTRPSQQTLLKMPLTSDDSDFDFKIKNKTKGVKRKLLTSNSSKDSDSSSKFFKKTPKRKLKNNVSRTSLFDLTSNCSSSNNSSSSSSNEDSSPVNVRKRRRIKNLSDDESEEVNDSDSNNASNDYCLPKKGRKNIRKMKKKGDLSELTQSALQEEILRKKRIEKRQQEYNKFCNLPRPMESCKKLVLDFDENTMEDLVTVHPDLVKFLKPHQVKGITFLWNSVFESLARIKEHKGNGSILAHCMGLGKTLQIITLIHTLFRYPETGIKTVLIITPNATIENWCKEFHKWLHNIDENHFLVLNFTDSKTYEGRKNIIDEWKRDHGVLITSYQLFRSVVNFKNIDKFPTISESLVDPGPDLVICDEGHVLKNHSTAISKAVNRIKSLRRIVLTGTPLQNNLREYHCMVDFIRPNLLGSIRDFTNRFINPITNGQYSDSTAMDVRIMKRRSHVLHRMLEGFVQRFDYSVLTPFLPPKHEYVIYLKMADIQIELYQKYLDDHRQPELFSNYHMLQMVWTHPKLLALYLKRAESKREKQKLKDEESRLLNDESSDTDCNSNSVDEAEIPGYDLPSTKNPDVHYLNWWKPLISKAKFESVYPYSKFIMMFSILQECENIGDKVLLFSQSLFTLDLIQDFLENAEDIDDEGGPYGKSWDHGLDFYRIDGSTSLKAREDCCERFNDVNNHKMRLLLLSTKAFNLGINLVGANRVIIFDVTWNPSLNVQSIFRVFRFGQNKPCYIYRLISEGTMEQKIYERQISKLSTAFRVVDEHQIDRHFNLKCQEELYEFEPNTTKPKTTLNLPKDRLMAELILKHKDLVMDILEHDSLLQNNEAEELDENDRNAAWEDYEKERDGIQRNNLNSTLIHGLNLGFSHVHKSNNDDLKLFNSLREFFPQASMLQLNDMLIQIKDAQSVEQ